jgi:ABC-2 type transport system ATP-binding protein
MNDEIVIKVENVSKVFKLPHEKQSTVKSVFINLIRGGKRSFEKQEVLKGISFEVKRGEFFGIVGRNGGGKSTLLKILAGIYSPTTGAVKVVGKLTPFIELGVGFSPELTGRENVFLNGALLGFSRKEMDKMYNDIVNFAELEKFMDQKLKNYSSGMQVRLAFSIAIRAKSEILVMDEVLAVGDAAFQKKCFDVFRELKNQGRTIILVTHDMANVERFCDRVLVLHKSKILKIGTPQEASSIYSRLNIEESTGDEEKNTSGVKRAEKKRWGVGGIKVSKTTFYDKSGKASRLFEFGYPMLIKIDIERDNDHKNTPIVCGLAFYNQDGVNVIGPNSSKQLIEPDATEINVDFPPLHFAPGEYKITIALFNSEQTEPFDFLERYEAISVISDHTVHGLIEINTNWSSK